MTAADYGSGAARACPEQLRAWFRRRRRDLPWRLAAGENGLRDPYRSWVAEIMLQQTRVEAVVPYYLAFLERFPRVEELAAAKEETLLRAWAGLGYYRRARHLQAAAQQVVAADGFPTTHAGWLALPGIGPYTAAALSSLVLGERYPVVDGNVKRVVARLEALDLRRDDPALHRAAAAAGEVWMKRLPAEDLSAAGELNEALMELGATVCRARKPECSACPWRDSCRAATGGIAAELPRAPRKRELIARELHCLLIGSEDHFHLLRRQSGWNPGFLEPPLAETAAQRQAWEVDWGLASGNPLGQFRHSITHHRLRVEVWHYPSPGNRLLTGIQDQALTTIARKALARVPEGT